MNRKKSKLKQGPSLNGIIQLLQSCMERKRYFRLFMESEIYYKKSFMLYLKWCIGKKLISNSKILGKNNSVKESWIIITEKGRNFVRDFNED